MSWPGSCLFHRRRDILTGSCVQAMLYMLCQMCFKPLVGKVFNLGISTHTEKKLSVEAAPKWASWAADLEKPKAA